MRRRRPGPAREPAAPRALHDRAGSVPRQRPRLLGLRGQEARRLLEHDVAGGRR